MQNQFIQLVPADISLAEQAVDYYVRNKQFLEEFEPKRTAEFFSLDYQRDDPQAMAQMGPRTDSLPVLYKTGGRTPKNHRYHRFESCSLGGLLLCLFGL